LRLLPFNKRIFSDYGGFWVAHNDVQAELLRQVVSTKTRPADIPRHPMVVELCQGYTAPPPVSARLPFVPMLPICVAPRMPICPMGMCGSQPMSITQQNANTLCRACGTRSFGVTFMYSCHVCGDLCMNCGGTVAMMNVKAPYIDPRDFRATQSRDAPPRYTHHPDR